MIQLGKTNIAGGVSQTMGVMKAMTIEQAREKAAKAEEAAKQEKHYDKKDPNLNKLRANITGRADARELTKLKNMRDAGGVKNE